MVLGSYQISAFRTRKGCWIKVQMQVQAEGVGTVPGQSDMKELTSPAIPMSSSTYWRI